MYRRSFTAASVRVAVVLVVGILGVSNPGVAAIDSGIVYDPPKLVVGIEDPRCKQQDFRTYTACRLAMMKRDGATPEAIEFAKRLTTARKYFGYATRVSGGRFGPVAIVSTLPSGFSTYGSIYIVTPRLNIIDPDDIGRNGQREALRSATFRSLRRLHPEATVWPQAGGIAETRRRGGGQRFIITHPIVDGCHACKLLGAARYAYDFTLTGVPRGQNFVDARAGTRAWFGR
jgi:hypothetical protein